MKTKLINNNSNDIIIFLAGWGSDDNQYKNIKSKEDILICWDYSDLSFNFDFSKYENKFLISHSAGVYTAGLIKDKLPKIRYSVAINGNPKMFDEYFGIDKEVIKKMYDLNEKNYMDFRLKYIVYNEKELVEFSSNPSRRTFKSCYAELNKLEEYYKNNKTEYGFDIAIISDCDKIFDFKRQIEYFKNYIVLNNKAHNIFSEFNDFSELLKFAKFKQ